jgi:outer membrane receptor protein involved in Fe transport
LNDLYSPILLNHQGFTDLLTTVSETIPVQSQGNPKLQPEVARTYTGGIVYTPSSITGLTVSFDYYRINMTNSISTISASTTSVQTLCNQSGGTSPFCQLYVRPFPISNTSPANAPTMVLNEELNTAVQKTEGWDLEANYGFELADVLDSAPGSMNLRVLGNYQPVFESVQFPGAPLTFTPISKGHVTSFISYNVGTWTFTLEDRWLSPWSRKTLATDVFVNPKIPVGPNNNSTPDLYYMGVQGPETTQYDAIGRYFTLGVRFKL